MPFVRAFSCIAGALPFAAQARAWAAIIAAREARQTAAGASVETPRRRNVRTAQGSAGGNTSPPRGEDQSNRDEPIEFG